MDVETPMGKSRKANFTEAEKIALVEEYRLKENILKPKLGSSVSAKDKENAWQAIVDKVNSNNPLVRRTVEEVKKKWHNLTVTMKENYFKEKRSMQKTGKIYQTIL